MEVVGPNVVGGDELGGELVSSLATFGEAKLLLFVVVVVSGGGGGGGNPSTLNVMTISLTEKSNNRIPVSLIIPF